MSTSAGTATSHPRAVLVVAILASFVAFLDGTVVNVALPAITRELGGGLAVQQWVVDGYLITLGALILLAGRTLAVGRRARQFAVREAQLETDVARARLEAMRLEIQPHFLFNALNSIAALIRIRANDQALKMLLGLGELVRALRDHGIGIPENDHKRIFDKRVKLSSNSKGLGLGLWIVRELVQAMRGIVRVDSTPGRGAAFYVTLPRGAAQRMLEDGVAEALAQRCGEVLQQHGVQIGVVGQVRGEDLLGQHDLGVGDQRGELRPGEPAPGRPPGRDRARVVRRNAGRHGRDRRQGPRAGAGARGRADDPLRRPRGGEGGVAQAGGEGGVRGVGHPASPTGRSE